MICQVWKSEGLLNEMPVNLEIVWKGERLMNETSERDAKSGRVRNL